MIDKLLADISEDKHTNFTTTSNKFKEDLWKFFFDPIFSPKTAIEFGTHKGQTTRILAHLFSKVYTINLDMEHLKGAMALNRDLTNITYVPFDLYAVPYQVKPAEDTFDVFFIDAGHELAHVEMDIARALSMNLGDDVHFVFDDYGMMPGVRKVVDTYIDTGWFTVVGEIGHPTNYNFGGNPPRILSAVEGLICKLNKDKIEYE